MKKILDYLKEIGYRENNPFGHKIPDIIEMIRSCNNADDQGLFYDNEFAKLKSMINSYDRELKLEKLLG